MKSLYKTLLVSVLLATPFAATSAHESRAAHDAWVKAQKIDVQPTLTIKQTTIPADSTMPSSSSPDSTMPNGSTTIKSGTDKKM